MVRLILIGLNVALIVFAVVLAKVLQFGGFAFALGALFMLVVLQCLYRVGHGHWWGDNIAPIVVPCENSGTAGEPRDLLHPGPR